MVTFPQIYKATNCKLFAFTHCKEAPSWAKIQFSFESSWLRISWLLLGISFDSFIANSDFKSLPLCLRWRLTDSGFSGLIPFYLGTLSRLDLLTLQPDLSWISLKFSPSTCCHPFSSPSLIVSKVKIFLI